MKLAALDVGSNTVLMLVVEFGEDRKPHAVAEMSRITRLGRGVDAHKRLDQAAAQQTLDAIAEFADKARALGAEKIVGAATAALRDAADGQDFLARVRDRAGVTLEIISGEEEARLSYLSTRNGLALDPSAKLLIVDIGGGSTELIRAEPDRELEVTSLQIGSVRLTERFVHNDPPSAREATDLRVGVDNELHKLGWKLRPDVMVGIAGTVTTVCAIALGLEHYSSEVVHGHRLANQEVLRVISMLGAQPLEERKKLRGMEPGRADVLFAGVAILERLMEHFGQSEVVVSDQGVRWGLVWRELEKLPGAR
ncbi:MAG TPA: Ppx/GppA phosphatase family protein [Candidatus Binataceae bacterium]|nr:Ppx/GppA phosphatase family protein [Candidatus Binataceae bacterium]